MRPNLHLLTEHRPRRHRAGRHSAPGRLRGAPEAAVLAPREPQEQTRLEPPQEPLVEAQPLVKSPSPRADLLGPDVALRRVRNSGGPLDHASYACQCGYVFEADVSTTVECPHCAAPQAW
jgi:hypothetical protein